MAASFVQFSMNMISILIIVLVHFTYTTNALFNMHRGGNMFDSLVRSMLGPTAPPFSDPFSNSFGGHGNSFMNMFPFMMADIDHADRISGMADERAARQEEMQGRIEAQQGRIEAQQGRIEAQQGRNEAQQGAMEGQQGSTEAPQGSTEASQGAQEGNLRQVPSRLSATTSNGNPDFNRLRVNNFMQRSNPSLMSSNPNTEHPRAVTPSYLGHLKARDTAGTTAKPSPFVFRQNTPDATTITPPVLSQYQERNRIRLSQIIRSATGSQFKDVADTAISRHDLPLTAKNEISGNRGNSFQRPFRDRVPAGRQMDPDLMSDMMDLAGDMGMTGLLFRQMSAPTGRNDINAMQCMMEFMLTGVCNSANTRFGFGR